MTKDFVFSFYYGTSNSTGTMCVYFYIFLSVSKNNTSYGIMVLRMYRTDSGIIVLYL